MAAPSYFSLYCQGAILGLRGFSIAGIRAAGLKRSLGFFLQPVENWSRYPEISTVHSCLGNLEQKRVLDLGSPKMLGLLLAKQQNTKVVLTDIWDVAVSEIAGLISRNGRFLKGSVEVKTADLTQLHEDAASSYDAVYSLSVVEHIESIEAIRSGIQEMARVTRAGGLVVVSVPIRQNYFQEYHQSSVYGRDESQGKVFFSHYFDETHANEIFSNHHGLQLEKVFISSWQIKNPLLRLWSNVPQKVRGLFGVVNMLIAPWVTQVNEVSSDLRQLKFPAAGDLILKYRKV